MVAMNVLHVIMYERRSNMSEECAVKLQRVSLRDKL